MSQIFSEQQIFNFADVAYSINEKMIRRHPHVFADADSDGYAQRWEEIKRSERKQCGRDNSLEKSISRQLPALKRAGKAIAKTQTPGITEQSKELIQQCAKLRTIAAAKTTEIDKKAFLSEMLFRMVQLCVAHGQDAEELLRQQTTEYLRQTDRDMTAADAKK
jgi:uncharacterized protein YabN with tetrapyrrole methylase and pyrophosphatase domain